MIPQIPLTRSAGRGALWQILGGAGQTIIRISASMILARQLEPEDFGIYGMAFLVYSMFETLSASGMVSGLIAKKDLTDDDVSTCFWSLIAIRIILYFIIFLTAPFIESFVGTPNLTILIRVVSTVLLITAIGATSQALITKKLQFKAITFIRLSGVIFESGLAVILVLKTDLRYWALIISLLCSVGLINILMFILAKWIPRMKFNRESCRYLFNFGINSMGFSIVSYLNANLDYIFIAKLLGAKMLGFYEFAYRIPHMINERIAGPAGMVFFPSIANIKDDNSRIADAYIKATKYIAWMLFPAFSGLAILAPLIVNILWGGKWMSIITPMRILCISAAISSILQFANSVFLCKNRPDLTFKFSLLNLSFSVIVVFLGGYYFGINGVAAGMLLSRIPNFLIMHFAFKMIDTSSVKLLREIIKPLNSSIFMTFSVFLLNIILMASSINKPVSLIILILSGVITYIAFVRFFYKQDFNEIHDTFNTVLNIK